MISEPIVFLLVIVGFYAVTMVLRAIGFVWSWTLHRLAQHHFPRSH